MQAILFDLDGVFYEGDQPIAGGADVIAWVGERRIPHLFLTNTTSRTRAALVDKLSAMGVETDAQHILTPAVAARTWLEQAPDQTVALFVPDAIKAEFDGLNIWGTDRIGAPEIVVLGDLGDAWDYRNLNRILSLLMAEPKPKLLALGMTRYWKSSDGLRLDVGAFAKAFEYAAGVQPEVLGKPSATFYQMALTRLAASAAETVIIGDDIQGDVAGAQRCGIHAVLVRTGKFRASDLQGNIIPDAVLDSVAGLPQWWQHTGPG